MYRRQIFGAAFAECGLVAELAISPAPACLPAVVCSRFSYVSWPLCDVVEVGELELPSTGAFPSE